MLRVSPTTVKPTFLPIFISIKVLCFVNYWKAAWLSEGFCSMKNQRRAFQQLELGLRSTILWLFQLIFCKLGPGHWIDCRLAHMLIVSWAALREDKGTYRHILRTFTICTFTDLVDTNCQLRPQSHKDSMFYAKMLLHWNMLKTYSFLLKAMWAFSLIGLYMAL